ncbi:MAG: hypothetical protein NXY57DRAFT_968801 [Lentinula lateritia]|nr:MAG: hypothetical protein NXY57DRAFT_968801 [Lentinula lateritia]
MPSSSPKATFSSLSPPIRSRSSSRESVALASGGEAEQDQLAFTIESPSRPQLQLFENIFNTGKSLALYCRDDPLWSTLAQFMYWEKDLQPWEAPPPSLLFPLL